MPNNENRYVIPSVVRALRILEAFSFDKSTYTNAELSKKFGLNRSSVTRLLYSLEKSGFIKRSPETGAYQLTHKTHQVGRVYIKQVDYHTISMPVLRKLTDSCHETSHLGILDDMQVLYLDWVESKQTVSLASWTGKKLPAYCTGVGKNFLAQMDEETLSAYFKNTQLKEYTANTKTKPGEFKKHLDQIRKQGYALDNGEYQLDVISVSGPVFDDTGRVIAGISIAGPRYRMDESFLKEKVIPEVKQAAMEISKGLGWDEKQPLISHHG